MAVSKLSLVTLVVAKTELEKLIEKLYEFQAFHPNEQPPFYEEFSLTQLKSKSLDVYMQINNIVEQLQGEKRYDFKSIFKDYDKVQIKATDWTDLTNKATKELTRIRSKLLCKIKLTTRDLSNLVMFREAILIVFSVLTRIKIVHELKYFVTIQGYIPSKSEIRFREQFSRWYCDIIPIRKQNMDKKKGEQLEVDLSLHPPSIPTLLENPKFMKMFESVK